VTNAKNIPIIQGKKYQNKLREILITNMKKNMNIYQIKENLNLALSACKGIGLKIPGINPQAFIERKPHLILAVLWQIMRMWLTKSIDLKHCPELMRLAEEGEELVDLMKLPPE